MGKLKTLLSIISCILAISFSLAQFSLTPTNGICGDANGQTIESFPTTMSDAYFLCKQGEIENWHWADINNISPTATQTLYRNCKGTNGGLAATCQAVGSANYYNNSLATHTLPGSGCGPSNGKSFMTTDAPIGIAYTNYKNAFLGHLCTKQLSDGTITSVGPVWFNQSALGWTRQCPTAIGKTTCQAALYQHANCGISANTGHTYIPTTQLCAPGYINSVISFDPDTNLRSWQCLGNGGANPAYCQAWIQTDTTNIQPSCNPLTINQPGQGFISEYITSFPGSNACSVGTMNYRSVTSSYNGTTTGYTATWTCGLGDKKTPACTTVMFPTYSGNKGEKCEPTTSGMIFDSSTEIFARGLCAEGKVANYFQDLGDSWARSCGATSCSANKSDQANCGRAIHAPTRLYPTQGLCKTGLVATMVDTIQTGYRWERSCHPFREPNKKTYCKSPRIVDGVCKRQTLINTTGFSTPQEVLDAGLCQDGVPNPLVPVPDTGVKKRRRTCNGRGGIPSADCQAKVYLPKFPVIFDKPKPTSGTIAGPIVAELTGFNPIYVSFLDPLKQRFKLFQSNTGFTFTYKDRADNTQQVFVWVDWIDMSLPSALPIYSPNGYTSGNITVTLTGFTNPRLTSLIFTGSCLLQNICKSSTSINDITYTNVTFSGNGEGQFILVDDKGENIIPIVVNNIDRTAPSAQLRYNNVNPTRDPVLVEIINPSEPITTNIPLSGTRLGSGIIAVSSGIIFTSNGTFIISIFDRAGNITNLTASVNRIDTNAPSATVFYSTTGIVATDVVASLGAFTKTGTKIINNSGSTFYTFTYNTEFTFILEDALGNRGSVTAKVDWMDKPILGDMITKYQQNICYRLKQHLPVDAAGNEYNFHITTAIRNCLMKGYMQPNGSTYFYPRKPITRGEFLTILGRYIKTIADYQGTTTTNLSPYLINVAASGQFGSEISEADARGLLLYAPLYQSGTMKYINVSGAVSSKEAKAMLRHVMTDILNLDTKPLDFLISNDGTLTRGEVAYIFGSLIQDYEWTAMGNHLEFLKALNIATQLFTPIDRRKFITQILAKLTKIDDGLFLRVGLEPNQLKADLIAVAQNSMPKKKKRPYINVKTVMDTYLRNFDDPADNGYRNIQQIYTDKMYTPDGQYESNQTVWK